MATLLGRHRAVRSFDHHPGADLQRGGTGTPIACRLDRDAKAVVGRCIRDRVRIGAGPARPIEEAPDEELSRLGPQLVEVASLHRHRDDARRFRCHRGDPQPVVDRLADRNTDSPDQYGGQGHGVESPPEELGPDGVEVSAVGDLMGQGEEEPEVGVEVQQVPRLVPQLLAGDPDGGDDDQDDHDGADRGPQHPGFGDEQVPHGGRGHTAGTLGALDDVGEDVGDQQPE